MIGAVKPNMLEMEVNQKMGDDDFGREAASHTMRWYGWGSPVGLGLFATLIATAIALVRIAIR